MTLFKLEYNIISITLALNITLTSITFTESEFGNHQYNVHSNSDISYSAELEDYNNSNCTDEIITNKDYLILKIKDYLSLGDYNKFPTKN